MRRVAITLDVDWAPDFMIDHAAGLLAERGARATWFVTHASPAVDRLRERPDLFELGIHPNFLPGSSHGATAAEVVRHCAALVPGARAVRTHCLMQSTPLHDVLLANSDVEVDVSLFLPHAKGVEPVLQWSPGGRLLRVPYVWQDNMEMHAPAPRWDADRVLDGDGVRVLDFHPVHVWLNSSSVEPYERLKDVAPLAELTPEQAEPFRQEGVGSASAFDAADRDRPRGRRGRAGRRAGRSGGPVTSASRRSAADGPRTSAPAGRAARRRAAVLPRCLARGSAPACRRPAALRARSAEHRTRRRPRPGERLSRP